MINDQNYNQLNVEDQDNDQFNLTIDNFLSPGESTKKTASIFRDTIIRVQNDSESEDGCLLVKGFNKNNKKIIKASSYLEFRLSGTLMTDQFTNIGNTKLIISTDNAKEANNCKIN